MSTSKSTKKAIALSYDKSAPPKVVASGHGEIAEKIIEAANESGVPITQNTELLDILGSIPIGNSIPEEAYQVVAELLIFVYEMTGRPIEDLTSDS